MEPVTVLEISVSFPKIQKGHADSHIVFYSLHFYRPSINHYWFRYQKIIELSDAGLQQGTIVYSYYGKQASKFDTVSDIQVADLPLEQYYGTEGNILNLYNDNFKYKITKIYFLRFTKREV